VLLMDSIISRDLERKPVTFILNLSITNLHRENN